MSPIKNYFLMIPILVSSLVMGNSVLGFFNFISKEDKFVDLSLNPQEQEKVEALSRYTWGYFLSLQEDSDLESITQEYLTSIAHDPNSEYLVQEILEFWTRRNSNFESELVTSRLKDLAVKNPHSAVLNMVVANAYMHQENYPMAVDLLTSLFKEIKWEEPLLIKELAKCYLRLGDIKKADKLFRRATKPKRLRGNYMVELTAAFFYGDMSSTENQEISKRKRKTFERLSYAHALRAVDAFFQSNDIEMNPKVVSLISLLIRGNYIEESKRVLTALYEKSTGGVEEYKMLAECFEATGDFESALEIWDTLSGRYPFDPVFHARMGYSFAKLERYEDALLAYETAFKLNPNAVIAFEISTLYLQLMKPEKALNFAHFLPTNVLESYILQSHIYGQLNQFEKAEEILVRAPHVMENTDNGPVLTEAYYLSLATVYHSLNKKEKTIRTLEDALRLSPNSPEINNFLGYFLADENMELDRAEKLILTALHSEPDNPAFLDSLAWVLFRKGKFRQAAQEIERVLKSGKPITDGIIFNHAGDIYFSLGKKNKAIFYWKEAIKKNSKGSDKIKEKIENANPGSE